MAPSRRDHLLDAGLLVIRIAVAIVFLYHGSQKLFGAFEGSGLGKFAGMLQQMGIPIPYLSAVLAACAEFFGGLLLLLGIAVRVAVIPMIFTMLVAIVKVHSGAFSLQHKGMEYALTLGLVLLGLGLTGPGRFVVWSPRRRPAAGGAFPVAPTTSR
jgi:putative oxidoreductase